MNIDQILKGKGGLFAERYTLERQLGTGSMGTVYLATDRMLDGERIAIKILHPQFGPEDKHTKRFLKEVRLTRKVTHPNVVRTFDIGKEEEYLYFTMEYAGRSTLKDDYCDAPVSADLAIEFLFQICHGLQAIHDADIIHRDMKPGNVIIGFDGSLKISDFGVARQSISDLTAHNEAIGSAIYMSPEIWEGKAISSATDIYALGVMMYQLLTAKYPVDGDTLVELMKAHLGEEPIPPSEVIERVPGWFNQLVMRMLAKDPEARPQFAEEIIETIKHWTADGDSTLAETANILDLEELQQVVDNAAVEHQENKNAQITERLEQKSDFAKPFHWRLLDSAKSLYTIGAAVIAGRTAAALLLAVGLFYLVSGLIGGAVVDQWSSAAGSESGVAIALAFAVPLFLYSLLFGMPIVVAVIGRVSILRSIWIWAQLSFFSFLLAVCLFDFNCVRVGLSEFKGDDGIDVQRLQWTKEVTIRNAVQASLLFPRGTAYQPATTEDYVAYESDLEDLVINFAHGMTLPELYVEGESAAVRDALVLHPNYEGGFLSSIPYLLFCFVYGWLFVGLYRRNVLGIKIGVRGFLVSALLILPVAGLMVAQVLLEDVLIESFEAIPIVEKVAMVGPFWQSLDGYALLCSLINWTVLLLGCILLFPWVQRAWSAEPQKK